MRDDKPIPDERLAALAQFTRTMFHSRGNPSPDEVEAFLAAGYREQHILQIVLAMAVKTLSNYSNHVNHPPVDEVFADYAWSG